MALGGGLDKLKSMLPQSVEGKQKLVKGSLAALLVLLIIGFGSVAIWMAGFNPMSGDTDNTAIARSDPVVANLLDVLELHAKSDQYITKNFPTAKTALTAEIAKLEGKFASDPAFSSHPKKAEILAILGEMKTNLTTIESNLTTNNKAATEAAAKFIENKNKLNKLINQRDQVFPVSFAKNPTYSDTWFADRGDHKHAGTDIMAPRGTEVIAVADGTIERMSKGDGWGGYKLTIKPDVGNEKYYYAHIINIRVQNGQKVSKGQVIAQVGTANNVNHLHFGIKSDCSVSSSYNYAGSCWINPYSFLKQVDTRKK